MIREKATGEAALERRLLRRVWLLAAIFLLAVGAINALTLLTEAQRAGTPLDPRIPFILEGTSTLVLFALVPLVAFFERRFPVSSDGWPMALAGHIIGSLVFSALHVAGMVLLRMAAFAVIFGQAYTYFDEPLTDALYEYRKDLLPYAVMVVLLALSRGIEEARRDAAGAREEARETGRLSLRSGGRMLLLDAATLDWASAAGNYVEIRAGGRTLLARITLAALEQQLAAAGVPIARVHRSRLVNRARVLETRPTADGDFVIHMADGTQLRGSRRFRAALA